MNIAELVTLTGDNGRSDYPDEMFTGNLPAVSRNGVPQLAIGNTALSWVKANPVIAAGLAVAVVYVVLRLSKGKKLF